MTTSEPLGPLTPGSREPSPPKNSFDDSDQSSYPDPVDLFWTQVRARPQAVALVLSASQSTADREGTSNGPMETWTYERLESEVTNIASVLLTKGVRPGDRVAFCSPTSPSVLATIWAIFSLGAISVPLDPSHPKSRITRVLEETEPRAILGQRSDLENLSLTGPNAVNFDEVPANGSFDIASSDRSQSGYIFYTSGSTGDPKGVLCRMRQLAHYLGVSRERFRFTSGDRFCSIARPTFSICMWELLSPLTTGGSLTILDRQTILDPTRLCAALEQVTVAHLGPSLLKPVLGYLESEGRTMDQMRHVSSGGDIVPPDVMLRMAERFPSAEAYVIYGCTEISCMGCTFSVPRNTNVQRCYVGTPFDGVGVELVDEQGRLVAPGEVGEIRFSGAGLAECYFRRSDLTAEKFVESAGKRVYLTGDLGRVVDGQIEFLGRRDFQIQLRGIRIELGEVESALRNIPGIKDGVVAAWPAPDGEKVLVGYPVATTERFSDVELRARLAERLPEYMIPQYFTWLDALPLNHNLKIDRRALPVPSKFAGGRTPATDAERSLFAAAKKVLCHDVDLDLGLLDNGGSSLAALQLNLELRRKGAKEIPLSDLLSRKSLAELASATTLAPPGFQFERVPCDGTARLTTSQMRIWYEESAGEAGSTYAIPLLFELRAEVDPNALEVALNRLVARHDGLRYSVREVAGSPQTEIASRWELKVGALSCDSETDLNQQVKVHTEKPFDLSRAPLLRARLLDVQGTQRRLLLVFHHLVFDEYSIQVLLRELPVLYQAATGQGDALGPVELNYADFAQSEWAGINKKGFSTLVEYYKAKFDPAPEPLEIPPDFPRPAQRSGRSGCVERRLPQAFEATLQEQARKHGATSFVVLAGVFGELLRRYSSGSRIVLGTAIAGRHLPGSENSIGCFINMVPLDIPKADSPEIWPYLDRVRMECLQALEHGAVPFDRIVREVHPPRDPSRTVLYQAALIHHKKDPSNDSILGLREIPVAPASNLADVTLTVQESNDGMLLWLNYDAALFRSSTAQALLTQLVFGLEEVAAEAPSLTFLGVSRRDTLLRTAQARPSGVALSSPEQEQLGDAQATLGGGSPVSDKEILYDWNATTTDYPRDSSLVRLVEAQLDQAPERVAIRFGGQSITYGDLEARANQWARALRRRGVGRGQLVGLCLNRSIEMVVAVLAVLKSGAAYVPLDPGFPPDRLGLMIEDSGLTLVVSEAALRNSHGLAEGRTIEFDSAHSELAQENTERLPLDDLSPQADDTAYVLYTSGSTGRPKGVQVHHRAAVNFLISMQRQPGLCEADRLLAVTTLSFDISVLELLLPLLVGAQVVLADRDEARDGKALCRLLDEKDVTVMQATPATWRLLLESGWRGRPGFKVLCGGEALALDLAQSLLERASELWNMYGPTETTVWSSVWRVQNPEQGIRIGRPIANTSIWILDSSRQICPIGVVGEIYIGGDGVAMGYLNHPELTSERFFSDPFSDKPGARLYKTGDLGRWRTDGELECLGRNDFQVKIRGFRIELEDIESALVKQPEVASAVVVAREDTRGDRTLAAYLVPKAGHQIDLERLRAALGAQLPSYMVPSALVVLDALPLTPNNKVDRKALLDLPLVVRSEKQPGREPANLTERHVLRLFQIALEDDSFRVDDSFFERGGHSLLAVGLTSQLSNAFGVEFPVGLLFQAPSPSAVAKLVKEPGQLRRQPILLAGRSDLPSLFLVLGVHLYRDIAAHLGENFSVYGTYVDQEAKMIEGAGNVPSVEELAQEYIETIRRAQPRGPYRVGGASLGGVIAFEMAQQLRELGEEVEIVLLLDAVAPVSLRRHIAQVARRFRGFADMVTLARTFASKIEAWVGPPVPHVGADSRWSMPEKQRVDPLIASFQNIRQQAYKHAALSYGHRIRPYPGKATLVVASHAHVHSWANPAHVWRTLIADLTVLRFNAGHLDILRGQEARLIAEALNAGSGHD